MTRSLLLQMKIFMFGQALLGITLVRLLDLRALLVQRALDKQVQLVLRVRQAHKDQQVLMELSELMAQPAQLVLRALGKQELLVLQV